jgi:hypothetical protein
MFQPNCLSVLIGSLPIKDHAEALRLILAESAQIPLWPQLPKNPKEGMIRQFLSGFPGLIDEGNKYWIDTESGSFPEEMAAFYEECMAIEADPQLLASSRFALGHDTATGFFTLIDHCRSQRPQITTLKGQVTGPVTTGVGAHLKNGNSIFYDDDLRDMLIRHLSLKARWQVEALRQFTGETPPLLFIDEPGLVSFGSSGFSGISREMVTESVDQVVLAIHSAGGLAGLHICANGDWGPPLASKADIISFDAYFYFNNFILFKEQLIAFLARGGILAWGIVPTGDPQVVEQENVDSLYKKWLNQLEILCGFGFTPKQLLQQTLIAPSCGTGSLSPELATKVLVMTRELSAKARQYAKTL